MPVPRSRLSVRNENYVYGDPETYARDMDRLFAEEKFCDTRFLVGQKVHAVYGHKAIIAARCQAMSNMLLPNTGDLMQSTRSSHLLKDVEPEIFRLVSRFMYTNCITFDNINTNKLIDLLRASLQFQLYELAKLVEQHLVSLIDFDTVFELLNVAVKYKSMELTNTAMAFIIVHAETLLNANNHLIAYLTPEALSTILQNDDLPVDEMTLFQMAAEWAESFLFLDGVQPNIINRAKSVHTNTRSSTNPLGAAKYAQMISKQSMRSSTAASVSKVVCRRRQRIKRSVAGVMALIRYALLSPAQLKEIEANDSYKELIPSKCLADAWRILTFKQTGAHADTTVSLPTSTPRRRAITTPGTKKLDN